MVVAKVSGAALIAAMVILSSCDVGAETHSFASPSMIAAQNSAPQPATQAQKPAVSPQAVSQRDQSLIDSVEKAYQAGISNYHDGHIVAAKSNFDYAVDLMLRSGIDLKSDPALSEE